MTLKDYTTFYQDILEIAEQNGYDVIDPIHNNGVDTVKLVNKEERLVI
jgi:hypothetical protein